MALNRMKLSGVGTMITDIPRSNHFVWLRYLAAISIVLSHSRYFTNSPRSYNKLIDEATLLFPGVPVLFFISGFLVSLSYMHSSGFINYILKRIIRIYPPLWASFFVTVALLLIGGAVDIGDIRLGEFILWSLGQLTVVFFHHPDFFDHIGTGVINGSLWVIPIILQFYLLLPIIEKVCGRWENSRTKGYVLLLTFAILNIATHLYNNNYDSIATKVVYFLTILPWLFFFFLGYVLCKDFEFISRKLKGRWYLFVPLYMLVFYSLREFGLIWGTNATNPFSFSMLAIAIVLLAFRPARSSGYFFSIEKYIAKHDISLGIFIYHMVVLNLIEYYELFQSQWVYRLLFFFFATIILSIFSYMALERPIRSNRGVIIDHASKILERFGRFFDTTKKRGR